MPFDPKKFAKHATLDQVMDELYSSEEVIEIKAAAEKRSNIRRELSEQVSKALASYMVKENIGFNELERRLQMSSATTSKLLKGQANITLETIAAVSIAIGKTPKLTWSSTKS